MIPKIELYHDNFQNYKRYNIPKAQLVIADIPYNIGENAYASNPTWYIGDVYKRQITSTTFLLWNNGGYKAYSRRAGCLGRCGV